PGCRAGRQEHTEPGRVIEAWCGRDRSLPARRLARGVGRSGVPRRLPASIREAAEADHARPRRNGRPVRGLVTHYVLFVIDLATRDVENPDALFMAQVARNLTDHVDGFPRGKQ